MRNKEVAEPQDVRRRWIEPGEYTLNRYMMLVEIADIFDQGLTNETILH